MKFSNGCWLNKEGVTSYSPAKVYETKKADDKLTLYVPHNHINHRGDTLTGPVFTVELTSPMENVIKVTMFHYSGGLDHGPAFKMNENNIPIDVTQEDGTMSFSSGELKASIAIEDNWNLTFSGENGPLTNTGWRNMGYMEVDGDGTYVREQLQIGVAETIYGLGERFTPFIKNGQSIDIWNKDGGTSTEQSYKNIPFYLSSKGYGIFVNHPEKVSFEVGSEKVNRVQFSVPGERLEYYIINGPTPKEVLSRYTDLTGKPGLPPAWSFGLWLTTSFTTNYDEATVTSFIEGMAERDLPLHTFHFDCFWMKAFNWCDFTWDKEVFPDPVGMLQRLKEKGLHICVWINPYIAQQSSMFDEGKEHGYFIKRHDGSVWQWDLWQPGMAIVDFTNPDACRWYESKLEALINMGVDSFKTDFGERIPTDVVYHDGSDPVKMHNYYTHMYNEVVYRLLERKLGKNNAVLFARSAAAGGQQFPVHWGGDCTSEYESMAESLRGGLSLCMSGFGFWSHDIGGFESTSTADVYKRWVAFGLMSSHSRLHGSTSYRVPWLYDEESVDVLRFFTKLKCTLMPYLYTQAINTSNIGVPMMRAMLLEHPADQVCRYLDKQYYLGDNLLVAPVFFEDGNVDVYIPEGRYTSLLNNEVVVGPTYRNEQHDFLSMPIYVTPNTVLAVGADDSRPDYDYTNGVCFHLFELNEQTNIEVPIMGTNQELLATFKLEKKADTITIDYDGNKPFDILLRNIDDIEVCDYPLHSDPLGVKLSFDGSEDNIVITLKK